MSLNLTQLAETIGTSEAAVRQVVNAIPACTQEDVLNVFAFQEQQDVELSEAINACLYARQVNQPSPVEQKIAQLGVLQGVEMFMKYEETAWATFNQIRSGDLTPDQSQFLNASRSGLSGLLNDEIEAKKAEMMAAASAPRTLPSAPTPPKPLLPIQGV